MEYTYNIANIKRHHQHEKYQSASGFTNQLNLPTHLCNVVCTVLATFSAADEKNDCFRQVYGWVTVGACGVLFLGGVEMCT